MNCSIPQYISNKTSDIKEAERLSDLDYGIRKELIDSKLFKRVGNNLLMPKNGYGTALSKIGTINQRYSNPPITLSQREIGEVIKVDVTNYFSVQDMVEITEELQNTLIGFVQKINPDFKIEVLNDLFTKRGVYGIANIKDFVISLQEGSEGNLPEEVAHFFVELLPSDSKLFSQMNEEIVRTKMYKDVVGKYNQVYKGDTQRLKNEAMAQLISLYLTDKVQFRRMSGSSALIDNLIRWIKEFFGFIKTNSHIGSFIDSANQILSQDISNLDFKKEIEYDEMFAISQRDIDNLSEQLKESIYHQTTVFESLGNLNVRDFNKVYLNLNDTILDSAQYALTSGVKKKDFLAGEGKANEEYVTNAPLTPLGLELKEKKTVLGNRFVIYTSSYISDALRERIRSEFDISFDNIDNVLVSSREEREVELPNGTIGKEKLEDNFWTRLNKDNKKSLIVDNDLKGKVSSTNVTPRTYTTKKSKYENIVSKYERERKRLQGELEQQAIIESYGNLSFQELGKEMNDFVKRIFEDDKFLKIYENLISKLNREEVKNTLTDTLGKLSFPIESSKKLRTLSTKLNAENFANAVKQFTSLIDFTNNHFIREAANLQSKGGRVQYLINEKELTLAIWDLNKTTNSTHLWKQYIAVMLKRLESLPNAEITRKQFNELLSNVTKVESLALNKATEALSLNFLQYFEGYNANRGARIKDQVEKLGKDLSEKQREKIQKDLDILLKNPEITAENLAKILLGKEEKDISAITMWVKTLINSSDPLVYGLDALIQREGFKKEIETTVEIQQEMGSIIDEAKAAGIDEKDLSEIIFLDKDWVWDSKEGKKIPKPRLALLNPFMNTYRWDEKKQEVDDLEKKLNKFRNDISLLSEEERVLTVNQLEKDWRDAKKAFEDWKIENFNQPFSQEYYRRFDTLKSNYSQVIFPDSSEPVDMFKEAVDRYSAYFGKIEELEHRLLWSDNVDEQQIISNELERHVSEQRRLRSLYNSDGSLKTAREQIVATILKEKGEIDTQFFTSEVNHKGFKKDLFEQLASTQMSPEFNALLNSYLDATETVEGEDKPAPKYDKIVELLKGLGNQRLSKWLDIHTKVIFTKEFYDTRKQIVDRIAEISEQLKGYTGQNNGDIKLLWDKILGITAAYRNKDGVLNGDILSIDEQGIVKDFEEQVEEIKRQIEDTESITDRVVSKEEKDLKTEWGNLVSRLTTLQSKNTTQLYEDTFLDKMMDSDGTYESFADLFNVARNNQVGYGTDTKTIRNEPNFKKFLEDNPSHPFSIWFNANHYIKRTRGEGSYDGNFYNKGEFQYEVIPIYVWNKITPNKKEHISATLTSKYNKRIVVKEHVTKKDETTFNETTGKWLPIRKRGEFWNDTWHKFMLKQDPKSKALRSILTKLERFHFKSQEDTANEGKIGWFLNSVQRHTVDGSSFNNMVSDFFDKSNRFEEGESNAPSLETARQEPQGWFNRMKANLQAGVLNSIEEMNDGANYDGRNKIPVAYSYWSAPEDISTNLFIVFSMYRGSTKAAKAMIEAMPSANLSIKVLEHDQINFDASGNPIRTVNAEGISKNKNRIEALRFERKQRLYGFNKTYELGKGWDKAYLMVRKLNSFGSLSDVTGIVNNVKNGLAGRIQNAIQADYINWASNSTMRRAAAYKNNNFFWFLNQAEKPSTETKDKDWYIQNFFNPSNSAIIQTMGLKGAKNRFLKTELFKYSSHIFEYAVSSNLIYAHLFHKKVEKGDGVGKEVKNLHDIIEVKEGKISVMEGYKDSRTGRAITLEYLMDTRKTFKSMLENVNGKVQQKTMLSVTTIGQAVLYFKSWLIPMLRRRFDERRENYSLEDDVEGYWRTMIRFFRDSLLARQNMYVTFDAVEQRNIQIAIKEMATILIMGLAVSLLFGFDYDDPDKYKKLAENSWAENIALQLLLQTQGETESLSVFPVLNVGGGFIPPVLQEGTKLVEKPWIGWSNVKNALKVLQNLYGLPEYDRDMNPYNIEEGELKSWHYTKKVLQLDDFEYIGNPEGKIQLFVNMLKQ